MKAIVQDRYGPSSVLRVADMPVPEIAADEVLVGRARGIDARRHLACGHGSARTPCG